MSLPPALGASCFQSSPARHSWSQQGHQGGWQWRGIHLQPKLGGQRLSRAHPAPRHCFQPPPGMAPQQEQEMDKEGRSFRSRWTFLWYHRGCGLGGPQWELLTLPLPGHLLLTHGLQLTRQALRAQECLQQITGRAGREQQSECRQGSNQVWGDHREEDRPPHASGNTARPETGSSQ